MKDSILLFNKPKDISSAGALNRIKKQFQIKSLGHAGTLDPFATGLLVVANGGATKTLPYFQNLPKEYKATVKLGIQTDTEDITGTIIKTSHHQIQDKQIIKNILLKYTGKVKQIPPKYSALKVDGVRAYTLAREQKEFTLQEREVYIDQIELLSFDAEHQEFIIKVNCSQGTYIRSLVRDIGISLETLATVTTLERTAIGNYHIQDSNSIDNITESSFKPIFDIFSHFPSLILKEEYYKVVINGAKIKPHFLNTGTASEGYSPSYYLLWSKDKVFLGIVDNRNACFFYRAIKSS